VTDAGSLSSRSETAIRILQDSACVHGHKGPPAFHFNQQK
jgi:hypothetical protein